MLHVAAGHHRHLDHTKLRGRLSDCTVQVTRGEKQDCGKLVFQNGMLQETELDDDGDGDKKHSYRRLRFGDVKRETESTAEATQDQAVSTDGFKNRIWNEETDSKWRLCKQHEESIDRLIGLRMAQFGEELVLNGAGRVGI